MRRTHSRAPRAPSNGPAAQPARSVSPPASLILDPAGPRNERFRTLFERASVGIISVGADGRAGKGRDQQLDADAQYDGQVLILISITLTRENGGFGGAVFGSVGKCGEDSPSPLASWENVEVDISLL